MRRFVIVVCVVIAASLSGAFAATTDNAKPAPRKAPAQKLKIAPADEYFGRLKMSILGIANTIKDQTLRYDRQPEQLDGELNAVNFAVDAIRDWERKYPRDPWIAKSLFYLERFYNRIPTDAGRAQAKATMVWLVRDFPDTWYGRTGKLELSEGKVGAPIAPAAVVQSPPPSLDVTKPIFGQNDPPASTPP